MHKINILLSDELKAVLEEIQDSSSVARLLLSEHDKKDLKEDHANYLSISNLDKTKLSYLTKERLDSIPDGQDPWTHNKRFFARPASVINKIFNGVHDKDLEVFNNLYKSILSRIKFTFKILSGNDIRKYYHGDMYRGCSGSLGNSCMKYDNCQRYMGLYVDNSDVVTMLGMFDDDQYLLGRALLWNFDSYKVMDRIYTVNDEELSYQFKRWAIANGYMYKYEQKWNNSLAFELGGKKIEQKFAIQLKNWKYDRYPYMDTFKFFDKTKGILYNFNENTNLKTLCAPDGSQFENDYLAHDFSTGLFHHRGETVSITYMDGKLIPDSTLRVHTHNAEWSRINNMYMLKKDVEFNEELDDFLFIKELDHLNNQEAISIRKKEMEERKKKQAMERARHEEMLKMLYEQQRITLTNTDQTNSDPARDRYITVDEGLHFFEHAILGRARRPRVHPIDTVSDNFTTPPTVSDNFTQEDPALRDQNESRFYITADPMPSSWTEPAT